jgi:hypothetical protein
MPHFELMSVPQNAVPLAKDTLLINESLFTYGACIYR